MKVHSEMETAEWDKWRNGELGTENEKWQAKNRKQGNTDFWAGEPTYLNQDPPSPVPFGKSVSVTYGFDCKIVYMTCLLLMRGVGGGTP